MILLLAGNAVTSSPEFSMKYGAYIDCIHQFEKDSGETQSCLQLTSLPLTFSWNHEKELSFELTLNPYARPVARDETRPIRELRPSSSDLKTPLFSHYQLSWTPRPHLTIGIGTWDSSTSLPDTTQLSLAQPLNLEPWRQTALSLSYDLPALPDMKVTFVIGNGEGEIGENMDPQQYFGFQGKTSLLAGIKAHFGISMDENSSGSQENVYRDRLYKSQCNVDRPDSTGVKGYSTQRIAFGLEFDAPHPSLSDLKAAMGWQRDQYTDLDKTKVFGLSSADFLRCRNLDPSALFVDSNEGGINTVRFQSVNINLKYHVLPRWFVASDFQKRTIDTGSEDLFLACAEFEQGACQTPKGDARPRLKQDAFTIGSGLVLTPSLTLTAEYQRVTVDNTYTLISYRENGDKRGRIQETFATRIRALQF